MKQDVTTQKKTRPAAVAAGASVGSLGKHTSNLQCSDKSSRTEDQERRIIDALRRRPHTTDEFRVLHGIFQISARIWGLRAKGYQIETTRVTVVDHAGFPHPQAALYSLVGEPEGAA